MNDSTENRLMHRGSEWFVPKFGPPKFRRFVGLLFLPYTAMVLGYAVIGSVVCDTLDWTRVLAIVIIYFLGLGVAGHALDALGSKNGKPWGSAFSRSQLAILAAVSLAAAYAIAVYYMIRYVPWLWTVAVLEGFFVFAYNLEWFGGKFHTDLWFAFSWGFLPVLAGHMIQTNKISLVAVVLASSMAMFSLVEIKASRPYKNLKKNRRSLQEADRLQMQRYEMILKCISLGVILLASGLILWRVAG
ncbi:MAG: hypothetical protein P8185_07085 [Deltaproteobacteria bacterium]|jgi:hypothetical protein